jgi:hypothetical protein
MRLGGVNLNDITTSAYSGKPNLSRFITTSGSETKSSPIPGWRMFSVQ